MNTIVLIVNIITNGLILLIILYGIKYIYEIFFRGKNIKNYDDLAREISKKIEEKTGIDISKKIEEYKKTSAEEKKKEEEIKNILNDSIANMENKDKEDKENLSETASKDKKVEHIKKKVKRIKDNWRS